MCALCCFTNIAVRKNRSLLPALAKVPNKLQLGGNTLPEKIVAQIVQISTHEAANVHKTYPW